jgi:excisionase family DNA binding protein
MALLDRLASISGRSKPDEKRWLTVPEAAQYTGLSETFLRRAIRAGNLPYLRDRALKMRRADLDNFAVSATSSRNGETVARTTP